MDPLDQPIRDPEVLARAEILFDLCETAEQIMRQNIRRRNPGLSEAEVEERLVKWRRSRPDAPENQPAESTRAGHQAFSWWRAFRGRRTDPGGMAHRIAFSINSASLLRRASAARLPTAPRTGAELRKRHSGDRHCGTLWRSADISISTQKPGTQCVWFCRFGIPCPAFSKWLLPGRPLFRSLSRARTAL